MKLDNVGMVASIAIAVLYIAYLASVGLQFR